MANPRISSDIEFVNAERAFSRVQDLVSRKPIKIQLAADAKGLDSLDKGLGRLSGRADEFSKSLEAANARVLAFGASVSVITAIEVAFKKLITTTISVEAAFKKIEVVGDQFASTAGQLEKFGRGIFDVARQTGQSFDVTATAALEFARQGLSAAETLKRVKDALTLTRLSGLDATSSVEGLTAAVNAFRKEGLTTTDVINKLIAVDNKYAVSSADLIEAIKRSGSFAQDAGTSFDELAATVTVLQEVTARGGSVIGNSLKTIFERVRRPESIIQLQNLGVEVRGVKGEMLPAIKIIDNFAKKLNQIEGPEKQTALRQLAGTFQINQLSALVGVLGEAEGAAKRYDAVLATSANASIEASLANQKLNESLDSQVKSVLASATEFGAAFGNLSIAPLLKDVLKDSGDIFGVLTDSLQSEGPSIGKLFAKVFGDALAVGLGAGTLVVSRFIINFVKFAKESFSTVLRINDASKNQEGLQLSILNLLRSRSDVEQAILSAGNSEVAQAKVLRDLYNEMAATEARRLSISNAVSKNLNAGGFVVGSTGLPTPRGKGGRAADGYVPNLVQAEYKDVMKGVGGANKNSKIISLENFPFSGGKKGTMVVNSSEGIMPLGNGGAAVLTKDMMGRRAAKGDVPYLSKAENAVRSELQKKRQDEIKKLEKEASDAQKARAKAEKDAARDAEKRASALAREQEKLAKQQISESKKQQSSAEKARKEKERAEKLAQEAAKKAADAELKAARVKEEEFRKKNPVTAQLQRDQQLRASGKLLPPVSGGFGAFGRSAKPQIAPITNIALPSKGNPLALTRTITDLGEREITNPLGSYQPIRGSAKASDSLSRAIQIGAERRLEELAKSPRGFSAIGNSFGRSRTIGDVRNVSGGSSASFGASSIIANSQNDLIQSTSKLQKTFSQAAIEFGTSFGTVFLSASVLKETLSLVGLQADKLVDGLSKAVIAVIAIQKLGQLGGINADNLGSFGSKFSKKGVFGRAFGLGKSGAGNLTSELAIGQEFFNQGGPKKTLRGSAGLALGRGAGAISGVISGFVKFLPILGQLSVAAFAASSILEAFGIDVSGVIYKAFGGLSDSAKRAKDGLEELGKGLFENGKFIGKSREDVSRSFQESIAADKEIGKAKRAGDNVSGKSPDEIAFSNFTKELQGVLGKTAVGGKVSIFGTKSQFISGEGDVQVPTKIGERDKLLSDLPKETQDIVLTQFAKIQSLVLEDLQQVSKKAGLTVSGKESIDQLRSNFVSQVSKKLLPEILGTGEESIGGIPLQKRLGELTSPIQTPKAAEGIKLETISGGNIEARVRAAVELKKLQTDFSTLSERELQTKLRTSQLDEVQKTILQNQLTVLEQERDVRSKILAVAEDGINKFSSLEQVKSGEILVKDFEKALEVIRNLGGSAKETKQKLQEFFGRTNLGTLPDVKALQKSLFEQIDGQKKLSEEKKKQIEQTNQQALLEAKINESLRLRQSLIQSRGELTTSRLESQRGIIEGRSSILSAQSGNPNLSIGAQNSLKREQINQDIKSLEIQRKIAEEKKKTDLDALGAKDGIDFVTRGLDLAKINEEYKRSTQSIDDQTKALQIQAEQVGLVTTYYTSLAKSIEQFYLGLGELEGTNAFNILQSGDLSSLLSGLSGKQALSDFKGSGKSGEEGIQFYTERLSIRQKESEIIAVQTEAQKLQLEQEKKLLEDIFRIKKEGGTAEEQITKLIEAQNSRLKEQRSIRSGVRSAQAQLQDETNQFGATFGETATLGFRDAISEAMKAAANNTGDLKNALLDVALSFANKLRDAALDNLANIITNGVTGGGSGGGGGGIVSGLLGLFSKKATGGKVTGGSGNKDDVPTLLMGGEYVVNKKSVQKYGPQFFEALNQGRIGGMASGGMFDPSYSGKAIRGSGNLKRFASQNSTSGANDRIQSLGGGAGSVELEPESIRLTNFGRENSPLFQATQGAKEQALGLVFEDQRLQKQYKDALKAKSQAEKEKLNQLYLSLAIAAVGAGVGSLGSGSGSPGGEGSLYGQYNLPTYDKGLNFLGSTADNARVISQGATRSVIKSASSAANVSSGTIRAASNLNLPVGGFDINSYNNPLFRAAGGPVNGNGHGDNVPAMLTGGEFVLNRRASKKLGFSNLSAANTGQSLGTSEETSKDLNDKVVTKLDELIQTISSTGGGVSVNVQMDSQGKTQSSESGDQGETQRNLNRRIKDAVIAILQEEKRLGGVLR